MTTKEKILQLIKELLPAVQAMNKTHGWGKTTEEWFAELMKLIKEEIEEGQEGWNAALDEAAARIGEIKGFGQATQDSFAIFIQGLKK